MIDHGVNVPVVTSSGRFFTRLIVISAHGSYLFVGDLMSTYDNSRSRSMIGDFDIGQPVFLCCSKCSRWMWLV